MVLSSAKSLWSELPHSANLPNNGFFICDGNKPFSGGSGLVIQESLIPNPTKLGSKGIRELIRYHRTPCEAPPKDVKNGSLLARLENDHLFFFEGLKFLEKPNESRPLIFVTNDVDVLLLAMQLADCYPDREIGVAKFRREPKSNGAAPKEGKPEGVKKKVMSKARKLIVTYYDLHAQQIGALNNKIVHDMIIGGSDYWAAAEGHQHVGQVQKLQKDIPAKFDGKSAVDFDLAKNIIHHNTAMPVGHEYFFWSRNLCTCFRAGRYSTIFQDCFESVNAHQKPERLVYAQTQPLSTLLLGVAFVYLRFAGIGFNYVPEDFIQVFENDGLGNLKIEGPNSRPGDFVVPAISVACAIRPDATKIVEERLCRAYSEVTGVTVDTLDYSIMTAICQVFLPQSLLSLKDARQFVDPDTCRPLITKASSDTDVVRAIIDAKPFLHYIRNSKLKSCATQNAVASRSTPVSTPPMAGTVVKPAPKKKPNRKQKVGDPGSKLSTETEPTRKAKRRARHSAPLAVRSDSKPASVMQPVASVETYNSIMLW